MTGLLGAKQMPVPGLSPISPHGKAYYGHRARKERKWKQKMEDIGPGFSKSDVKKMTPQQRRDLKAREKAKRSDNPYEALVGTQYKG